MVVCQRCGVDSGSPLFCNSCGFPLNNEARRVAKLSREAREKREKESKKK